MESGVSPDQIPFQPLTGPGAATAFDCPLCGLAFTHGEQVCGGCPLSGGCDVVRCPRCSYSFPRGSRLVGFARRLLRRWRREEP